MGRFSSRMRLFLSFVEISLSCNGNTFFRDDRQDVTAGGKEEDDNRKWKEEDGAACFLLNRLINMWF